MSDPDHTITATVRRIEAAGPPEAFSQLAAAVLRDASTPALRQALDLADEVLGRRHQRRQALQRHAAQLRVQLAQIEQQLAG